MAGDDRKYSFEDTPVADSHRARALALADLQTLLERMQVAEEAVRNALCEKPVLVRYAMDVPMNIAWYEKAKKRAFDKQRFGLVGVILFAVVAMGVTWASAYLTKGDDKAQIAIAQVAAFVAMAYGVLKVIAMLTDQKEKLAGFSKASADLKEALFTFEETWRGKTLLEEDRLVPDFETAVLQEIANARRIARAERDAYFTGISSTVEVATAFGDALEKVGESATSLGQIRKDRALALEGSRSRIVEERQRLIAAKAKLTARQRKLERLIADKAEAETIGAAKDEIADAESEVEEAQLRLDMCVKSEIRNPG